MKKISESISQLLEISEDTVYELSEDIKPVVRFSLNKVIDQGHVTNPNGSIDIKIIEFERYVRNPEGDLYYIKDVDPKNIAFLWDPIPVRKAIGLIPFKEITTYHSFAAPVLFKPTIAEVLTQINEMDLGAVVAFEIPHDDLPVDESFVYSEKDKLTYQIAKTVLYKKA